MPTRGGANLETVFIVGAGFSSHAGPPLQSDFTGALLEARGFTKGPSKYIVAELDKFISESFHHKKGADAKYWPALEDIFTCLDLSANFGHFLGPEYPPAELRRVRGLLISRTIRMLQQYCDHAWRKKQPEWKAIRQFFSTIDFAKCAFISMNWDTVIERFVTDRDSAYDVNYRCGARKAIFPENSRVIDTVPPSKKSISVIKVHGSVNWLYCDNCRSLFWFPPEHAMRIADQILRPKDWKGLKKKSEHRRTRWCCCECQGVPLGARLATFSYRKALEFSMFQKSWISAEQVLKDASKWVFIGYSLPAADYEFKYLLKRVLLARSFKPEIYLVTGGEQTEATFETYYRFFGRAMERSYFQNGLADNRFLQLITNWFGLPEIG